MPDIAPSILFDIRVDAVDGAGIVMVQPAANTRIPRRFTATLMRKRVIGMESDGGR